MSGSSGEFPLHKAVAAKSTDDKQIKELLASGIPVDQKNELGETALHIAASIGRLWDISLLLEKGANMAETDNDKNTPLHRAAFNGHYIVVERLSKHTENLHAKNIYGFTPLFLAVRAAQWQEKDKDVIVKFLLKAGSDPLAETCAGLTPVQEAMDTSQYDLVKHMDGYGGPYVVTPHAYTEMQIEDKDHKPVDTWFSISSATSRTLWDREKRLGTMKGFMSLANDIMTALTSSRAHSRGGHLLGEDLYRNLVLLLKGYVRDVSAGCKSLEQKDVLPYYFHEWKRYTAAIKTLTNQYSYLNRHWIKREQDEGKNLYNIPEIAIVVWKADLVDRDARLVSTLESSLAGPHQETVETAMKALFIKHADVDVEPDATMGLMPLFEQQKALWRTRVFDYKRKEKEDFVSGVLLQLGKHKQSTNPHGALHRLTYVLDADQLSIYRAALLKIMLLDNLWTIRNFTYDPEPRSANHLKKLQVLLAQVPGDEGLQILRELLIKTCHGSKNGIFAVIAHLVRQYQEYETRIPPGMDLQKSDDPNRGDNKDEKNIKYANVDTTSTGRQSRRFLSVLQDAFADDKEIVASVKNAFRECDMHIEKLCESTGDVTEMARELEITDEDVAQENQESREQQQQQRQYQLQQQVETGATTTTTMMAEYSDEYSDEEIWNSKV